jgi:hypothetical protein
LKSIEKLRAENNGNSDSFKINGRADWSKEEWAGRLKEQQIITIPKGSL